MSTGRKLRLLRADLLGVASVNPAETRTVVSNVEQMGYAFRDIRQTIHAIGPELNLQFVSRRTGGIDTFVPTIIIIREFAEVIPATPGDIESWLTSAYKSSRSERIRENLSEVEELFSSESKDTRSKVGNFIRLLRKEATKLANAG